MAGQKAGPLETKLDTRTHVHPCFWQGQCQGHSCMRAGVTEVRNTRKAIPSEWCSRYVRTTAEATPTERLRNAVDLQLQGVTRRGAAGAEQRAPMARAELRPEDG